MKIYQRPSSNEKYSLDDTDEYGGLSGITSFDWIWLGLGRLADIASYVGGPTATGIAFLVTQLETSIVQEL
jgi:hypothetical protein